MSVRVGYQGIPGAYSEAAIHELLGYTSETGRKIEAVPFPSFKEAFNAVQEKLVDFSLIPVENNTGGTVHANYDLLLNYQLSIVAELNFRVRHCLLVRKGVTKKCEIKKIISHYQALAQCDNYIKSFPDWEREAAFDTAGSAELIKTNSEKGDRYEGCAAIASSLAAKHYDLDIFEEGIEDSDRNFTRFVLLRRQSVVPSLNLLCKTTVIFSLKNVPGALFKALACFSLREIDLTKIESRACPPHLATELNGSKLNQAITSKTEDSHPVLLRTGSSMASSDFVYLFHLDFLAHGNSQNAKNAISHLAEICNYLRVLGTYPTAGRICQDLHELTKPSLNVQSFHETILNSKSILKIAILGFGTFGQFLAKTFVKHHEIMASSRTNYTQVYNLF